MDFDNIPLLSQALSAGREVFCGFSQGAWFLQSDGSVISLGGGMEASPNSERAALWAAFAGWNNYTYTLPVAGAALGGVKNGGNVVIGAEGQMDAPASPLDALTVALEAVAAEAPAVTGLADGVMYYNATDHNLYVLTEGAWAEGTAPVSGKLYLAGEALYKYDATNYMTLL